MAPVLAETARRHESMRRLRQVRCHHNMGKLVPKGHPGSSWPVPRARWAWKMLRSSLAGAFWWSDRPGAPY
jgi:hypothetical protein